MEICDKQLGLMDLYRLPEKKESPFASEAEKMVSDFARKWNIKPPHFDDYNTMSRFLYSGAKSVEPLAATGIVHGIFFFVDDLFFDTELLRFEDYGLDPALRETPREIAKLIYKWMHIFRTGELPAGEGKIENAFYEIGEKVRELSSPSWFEYFVDTVQDYIDAAIGREAGLDSSMSDLNRFIEIRERDTGGIHTCVLIELTNNAFLPDVVRENEVIQKLTTQCIRTASFTNDIFSYHKDVVLEESKFNLIKLFIDLENLSFEDAVSRSVEMTNSYARQFEEYETKLPDFQEHNEVAGTYVSGLKDLMSGNFYWHLTTNRYRSPDSPFAELQTVHE